MSVLVIVSRDFELGRTWLAGGVNHPVPHGTNYCIVELRGIQASCVKES